MQLVKTIKVKIHKPTNVKKQFLELIQENAKVLNHYIQTMKKHKTTSKTELHKLIYQELRNTSTLPSAIIQTSRDKAIEAYKSYKRKKKYNYKASPPKFNSNAPVRLDKRTFSLIETNNKLKYFAAITTNNERIHVPLLGQRYQYKYLKKILNNELQCGTVELLKKEKDFYLYIAVKKEIDVNTPNKESIPIGVDLGLINISTSVILKDKPSCIKFYKGNKAIAKRNYFAAFRQSLGKAKKLWRIKKTKEKESRYMRDLNHKVSNSIVQQALTVENPVIVMENLKHIRQRIKANKKLNKHLHNWSFSQLQSFIEYKAHWQGIPIMYVSPKYTSQRCSKCSHTEKTNRKGKTFRCKKCSYELNADLNAAINIAQNYKNFASSYMLEEMGNVAMPPNPAG
ncbi:MAG: transposase [Candidatus Diapherotrites archaeon]